jgi:hypothetical protein
VPQFVYGLHNQQFYNETDDRWTYGTQPVPYPTTEQASGWLKAGLSVAAIAAIGHARIGQKRGFDYLVHAARAVEEYSPGHVFRTFQLSHLLSVLETPSSQYRYFDPQMLSAMRSSAVGREWLEHLSRLTGQNMTGAAIMQHGFRFEAGQLRLGATGGDVLLARAGVVRAPLGTATRFQEAYMRSLLGGPLPLAEEIATTPVAFRAAGGEMAREPFMFVGGRGRLQSAWRYLAGYGTSLAERINQLARAPFELPVISGIMRRIPAVNRLRLSVTPSSGLKTVAKITAKLGLLGYGAYLGYQELDYQARQAEWLDNTIFAEGLTAGLASVWTRGNLAVSQLAEWTGLHRYREAQEEIAPRSTNLGTLLAFPLLGAAGGLTAGYVSRLARQFRYRSAGLSLVEASKAITAESAYFKEQIYDRLEGVVQQGGVLDDLHPRMIELIKRQTATRVEGIEGRIISKIAAFQQRGTRLGRFLSSFGKLSPSRLRWMGAAAVGAALALPFVPGALMPSTRPEELEALYAGEQRVPIRKGRWWEFGRSPYEGGRIDRYRMHWYPRMLTRAKEQAIWGEEPPSPLERWWIENFTYELERKHYWERPYPITGTAFEDIPFIGPLLSATLGRLVKPSLLMHEEEWIGAAAEGPVPVRRMPLKFGEEVLPGELEPGAAISPYGAKGITGQQIYNLTEMIGLPGFTMTAIKEEITGRSDTFDQEMQLESARRMYGAERGFWDLDLGGGLGTTELLRRLYPHRRRQIELYNPLRNTMPGWLPGPQERSPDFLHGDPYTKVPEGELRLPGPGYAALHPELKGVAPADYPLIHRFAILADVAPYTDKFKEHLVDVRGAVKRKQLSKEEILLYKQTMDEVAARKKRKEFHPYKYKERANTPWETALARANQLEQGGDEEESWFAKTVGRYWETITHGAETPFEFLTPVSPAAKLIHMRTAVEDYEKYQVYGTQNAFWGHPIRDFFGPFVDSAAHSLGWDGIPEHVQEQRDLEEYFDILKYVKYTRLKRAAQAEDDKGAVEEYEDKRRETLFGINPYTYNFSHIFRSLPRRDRDYFNEFVKADTEERAQILRLVPENERALMMARWQLKDAADIKKAIKKNLLTDEEVEEGGRRLRELYSAKDTEGFPKNEELWAEYIATRWPGESYADWYRRVKLLEEELEGRTLPGPDWVGWHPAVDLDDVKLKIVENEGKNMYDYDLWPDQQRRVARRPFIQQAAEALQEPGLTLKGLRKRITDILSAHNVTDIQIFPSPSGDEQSAVSLDLQEDRTEDLKDVIRRDFR